MCPSNGCAQYHRFETECRTGTSTVCCSAYPGYRLLTTPAIMSHTLMKRTLVMRLYTITNSQNAMTCTKTSNNILSKSTN